jgi:hypothetical protein
MILAALFTLAQGTSNTQEAPAGGPGAALIIGTILAIVLVFTVGFKLIAKRSKASRGGVEPVPGSREQGPPPLESIDRDR